MIMKPYKLGLYEKSMPSSLSLREKLEETAKAGFDCLELSIDETDEKLARLEWGDKEINALQRDIEETGVPVKSICLSGHRRFPLGDPDPAQRRRSLDIMEKAVNLAARLGIRVIQLAGYDVYYKPSTAETEKFFAEGLEMSVRMAAREGVILAFETMETPFIDTVGKAVNWTQKISSPYLQVYPDTGNLTNAALKYGHGVSSDMEKGAGFLAALHLKESKPDVYREVPYGQGHVDFDEAAGTAWRLGVRLFTAEFWYSENAGPWRAVLLENNRFLRAVLDRAAVETKEEKKVT
jgi:L-ribulose-5-phosphate 3-epimerase/hexulose-6-phosphate isomerase